MAMTTIDKEITAVEREYWDSMITKDQEVAPRLTADQSLIAGAQGISTVTPKTIGQMVLSDGWRLKKYDFSDIKVMSPAPDVAIIGYHVREELEVDGQPLTLEANDSTTWVRKNGRWLSAAHTESVSGDPFGRDRTSTRM
jgi:hypothetical protein